MYPLICFVSEVERMESGLRNLSQAELRQIREWLNDIIEDELEFTPEFERSIQQLNATWPMERPRECVSPDVLWRSNSGLVSEFRSVSLKPQPVLRAVNVPV
jgi:hypothetical protein